MQDSYRELFISESEEYLTNISNCLVKLEENPQDKNAINEIFRCVHTLKGMSATMGYEKFSHLAHDMEDLFDAIRNHKIALTSEITDVFFQALDVMEGLFREIKDKQESTIDIVAVTNGLKAILSGETVAAAASAGSETALKKAQGSAAQPVAAYFTAAEVAKIKETKTRESAVFKLDVTLSKECVMKEARAFLVITNLKRLGEVIKSIPPVGDLKEGKFEDVFTVFLLSSQSVSSLQNETSSFSEVEHIAIAPVDLDQAAATQPKPSQESAGVPAAAAAQPAAKKIQSMRIPVERLDKIMNLMGELAIARIRLLQIVQTNRNEALEEVSFALDRLISALQDEVMQTRLLPVAYILDAFPRVVRDISRKQNKDVELEISGSDIELDRVVLDEISDPLLHLVRNSVDHGIEPAEKRKASKKNPKGKVFIRVSRQKGQIFIEVGDDGRGIDFQAVKKTAISRGLITEEDANAIDEKKVLDLITLPGFSTAEKITDISGRGVGLDVVKSKIEMLGGRVDFETVPGEGSKFILTLPLTLAIIKAMLVKVEGEVFAVPLISIRETIKIAQQEVKVLQSFEVVKVRDEIIPIIRLNRELGIAEKSGQEQGSDKRLSLVIVEYGKKALGLVVSQVLGEQDIAVKPLGVMIKKTKGIAGATILGDGRVALILDIMSLKS
jgi:two-component system, chemotaxis family, sensor kinase CheA